MPATDMTAATGLDADCRDRRLDDVLKLSAIAICSDDATPPVTPTSSPSRLGPASSVDFPLGSKPLLIDHLVLDGDECPDEPGTLQDDYHADFELFLEATGQIAPPAAARTTAEDFLDDAGETLLEAEYVNEAAGDAMVEEIAIMVRDGLTRSRWVSFWWSDDRSHCSKHCPADRDEPVKKAAYVSVQLRSFFWRSKCFPRHRLLVFSAFRSLT